MDITKKYFKKEKDQVIFTGKKMEIFIPKRYAKDGYLVESDIVKTIGVFDMIIDGQKLIYNAPVMVTIQPSSSENVVEDGREFLKLTLVTGDVFLTTTSAIKNATIPYILFIEFINLAKYPLFAGYDELPHLFDNMSALSGLNFQSDSSVFEVFPAYLARDPDNINTLYKDTNMSKPCKPVAMRDVAHSAMTTTGKVIGSFMGPGINSALADTPTVTSDVEQHLRK